MVCVIDSTRESLVLDRAATPLEPGQQACSYVAGDFELYWSPGLLLHDDRASPDLRADHDITDSDLYQVAAPKLAVDRQIEQCTVSETSFAIEEEADGPDLLLCKRAFRAHLFASVPSCALAASIVVLRATHVSSPRP
ncbi:hypothetical protein X739_28460 [Mesorhizobium sp. LNHC220B00]|nr:hypothetical protein X739_28460 [Mesorhizobium sp. LNHC220B00]